MLRGSGRDHVVALRGHERAAEARRGAVHVRAKTCSSCSDSRRRTAPRPLLATAAAVLAALPAEADELVRATGLDARAVAVALAELELAGLACEGDGLYRAGV